MAALAASDGQESALDAFPRVYRELLPDVFSRPVPREELATCADCAMCAKPGVDDAFARGRKFFEPSVKCCSYHPTLANYLVGGALADESPSMAEGRRRLRERIRARTDCHPAGLAVPAHYALQYANKGPEVFGRSEAMLCPYFDSAGSSCTIWHYRDSTCSTYFCKHVKGDDGHEFWMAAKDYVSHLEHVLSHHLAMELGVQRIPAPAAARQKLSMHALDGGVDEQRYASAWGRWRGREEEFYIECHRLAGSLSHRDIVRIIGEFHDRSLAGSLEARHRQMVEPKIPDPLLPNPGLSVFPSEGGQFMVHSVAGAFSLSQEFVNLLWSFDGRRSTAEARERLRQEHGIDFSDGLLAKLYHNRILVEAKAA